MVLFASVAVALQAVLAAIPDAVHLLMCSTIRVNPCDYYFLCEPAARLEFVEIFAPYDRASMEHLCAGTYFNERISGAYVLWRVRGYLISRIPSLTFQGDAEKTTTGQMLLIWQYAWHPEFVAEGPSMSNQPNPWPATE
ncbi:hypothetical protein EDD17DRAFT_1659755 [Pisolithus thermaeus]|nr:hypothetical protein EV401DRAFT_2049372 [Pisolithus croceorrhizus]KAI6143490.1 hypothetical protein EDD17DRAFT_1659755 [Pisolithus thermaeus]